MAQGSRRQCAGEKRAERLETCELRYSPRTPPYPQGLMFPLPIVCETMSVLSATGLRTSNTGSACEAGRGLLCRSTSGRNPCTRSTIQSMPFAGDLLPWANAATADSRCEIALDEREGDEVVGGLEIRPEESTLSNLDPCSSTSNSETRGGDAKGVSGGGSAAGGMPPNLGTSSLEGVMLPGMVAAVAGERARSYKHKGEFQADNNHESRAKILGTTTHQASVFFVVEPQQEQAASSADNRTEDKVDMESQDPSDTDDGEEDPFGNTRLDMPVGKWRRNRRQSLSESFGEFSRALQQSRPTSILITEMKRLERNNRPKTVTELRRVHFRIPKTKRSWRLLEPVDRSGAAVKYWRMGLLLPIAWEMWAFPFRLAFCDVEQQERMFVYTVDVVCDVWFGVAMIGDRCEPAICRPFSVLHCFGVVLFDFVSCEVMVRTRANRPSLL